MKLPLCLAALSLGAALPAIAQVQLPANASARAQQTLAAKNSALDSFKSGDLAAGLVKVQANARSSGHTTSQDVQVAGDLCSIARSFAISGHANSQAMATLAATETTKARLKASGRDAVYLDMLAGDLYETVIGDGEKARRHYQSALNLDASRKDAAEGLKRLARLQALLLTKAQENAALRATAK